VKQRKIGLNGDLVCMSVMTYTASVSPKDKPLAWLHDQVKTPPFSMAARVETAGACSRARS
jgi:hypothetical protein